TGILLLMNYVPHTKEAFASVGYISGTVSFGWLIRRVHAIGANMFVFVLFLHMLSVLLMGSYKKPREMTWVVGCVIFGVTLTTCLSGYLLPWSQLSYWATTVATNSPGSIPVVGDWMVQFMRGSDLVSQRTLGRFFAMHVSLIPFTLLLLIGAHVFLMRRTGISTPPWSKTDKTIPFYPHFVVEDLKVIYFFLAILFAFVFFYPQISFPPDALVPADPLNTPEHIKPEWYFLANYQLLKLVPNEFLGIIVQGLAAGLIFFLPFIDRNNERAAWKRPIFGPLAVFGILAYIALIIWGHYS
ncbi:MAG: cytochrome bc complex cytochrome b subunit, partial [Deltaproteobacteria bacterium]|nr:cytochrome bc complex cytochrome b subunit [Deltaproteobacteria bacterium]